jgi:diketogulonate reductase-like aldo/keto reductase
MDTTTSPHDLHARLSGGGEIPSSGSAPGSCAAPAALDAVGWALEAGYRHIDTATAYHNENEVGRALQASGVARGDVFVTTKMPPEQVGRERATLERSLSAMGIDHVDLWLRALAAQRRRRSSGRGASSCVPAPTGWPGPSA